MGGEADAGVLAPECLDLLEVLADRLLAEALEASARVGDVEEDELDARLARRLPGRPRLLDSPTAVYPAARISRKVRA